MKNTILLSVTLILTTSLFSCVRKHTCYCGAPLYCGPTPSTIRGTKKEAKVKCEDRATDWNKHFTGNDRMTCTLKN